MSRYNEVYAEIKVKGKWHSLNPIVKIENTGEFQIVPIITGQSYLTPFFEYASDHCISHGIPDDLSEDLYKIIEPDKIVQGWFNEGKYRDVYHQFYVTMNYKALFNVVKDENKYQYSGFVDDKEIKFYEEDSEYEIENYHSIESFILLPAKERNRLKYFEWDDYSYESIYPIVKEIIRTISNLKSLFLDYAYKNEFLREDCWEIRLIVYGS